MPLPPVMFDFNRYRNSEVLNEEILDNEGAQELARKLIQTYSAENAQTNSLAPSPADQEALDKYVTGFLNAVVFEYGKYVRGDEPNVETLITRWNALATFFKSKINPRYDYYVLDKLNSDIVERIQDLKDWNDRGDDEEGNLNFNVNKSAMDMLSRYTKNGVIRSIPYSLIYSKDDVSDRRRELIADLELRRRQDYSRSPSPVASDGSVSSDDSDGDGDDDGGDETPRVGSPDFFAPVALRPEIPEHELIAMLEGEGRGGKKGKGRNTTTKYAEKDASLGKTPSGYVTSQSYPLRVSEKTVTASYKGKGKPSPFLVF